jgi:outer membrane protein assembly factor BamB
MTIHSNRFTIQSRRIATILASILATVLLVTTPTTTAAAAPAPAAGQYVPVAPVTVVNGLALAAGGTTTFTATGANGIPAAANVSAVALNVVAYQPSANGWLQVYPAGTRPEGNSTLNYQQGQDTASFEVVPVSSSGQISIYARTATKVIVRLRGYLTSAASTVTGGTYAPVPAATVVNGVSVPADGSITFTVTGANGIPASANVTAVALNVVAYQPSADGWLQAYPAGTRPQGNSTLNYQQGEDTASFEVVPVSGNGQISIYARTATKVIVRLRGYLTTTQTPRGADWSQLGNGPAHLGVNAGETVLTPSTLARVGRAWTVSTPQPSGSQPTVVDGVVYLGSNDHKVYALDAATGAVLWTAATGGEVHSTPAVAGGMVYVGSDDGKVYALDAGTGAPVWTATISGSVGASPAVVDGRVYIGSLDRLYALDAASGARVWSATLGGRIQASPAVAGGTAYVRSDDNKLNALNAGTGAPVWTASIGPTPQPGEPSFGTPTSSSPAVADGMVYVGSFDGKLYALNATTGATVWTASDGGGVQSTATVLDGVVYVSLARGLGDQRLHAFDGATGASLWTSEVDASAGPVLANGVLYVGTDGFSTSSGLLVALNPASGAVLWSRLAAGDSSPVTSVVVANGAVYAANEFTVSAHHA